ncbi:MAG: hypothetical protein WBL48_19455, partial [Pseudolabrys sp.]
AWSGFEIRGLRGEAQSSKLTAQFGGVRGVRGRRVNVLAPPVFHALRKIKAAAPLSGSALTKLSLGRISRFIVEVQGKELRN